jgi:hypothetical protein
MVNVGFACKDLCAKNGTSDSDCVRDAIIVTNFHERRYRPHEMPQNGKLTEVILLFKLTPNTSS